jgi:hypothetical protein
MYSLNISPPAGVVHADNKAHPLPALGRRTSVIVEPNFASKLPARRKAAFN